MEENPYLSSTIADAPAAEPATLSNTLKRSPRAVLFVSSIFALFYFAAMLRAWTPYMLQGPQHPASYPMYLAAVICFMAVTTVLFGVILNRRRLTYRAGLLSLVIFLTLLGLELTL